MKFLIKVLVILASHSYAFNYQRMQESRGYSNPDEGYYFKFGEIINDTDYQHYGFDYRECIELGNTLLCRMVKVDCNDYVSRIWDTEVYFNGIEHNEYGAIMKISTKTSKKKFPGSEYKLWGYDYTFGWNGIEWRGNVVEADSYEDKVCTENNK